MKLSSLFSLATLAVVLAFGTARADVMGGFSSGGVVSSTFQGIIGQSSIGRSSDGTQQRGLITVADAPGDTAQSGTNFVVNQTDDHDDGTCGTSDCTLREAVNAANGDADLSAITFDATVFAGKQTLTLTLGNLPPLVSDVTVSGPTTPGAGVTVKGTTPGSGAIFETDSGSVTLSALTVTNGFIAVNTRGGNTTVQNCTLNGNSSGVNSEIDGTKVQNCTVTSNSNKGISNFSNTLTVTSSTISGNRTDIFNNTGTTTVSNSIVTNGSSGINDGGFNLIGVDAKLGPLADNGGPTFTFALLAGSPAIDAGNTPLTTDQRGFFRPVDLAPANAAGGNGSDIGAFELNETPQSGANFVVNQTDDHDDGTCGPTDCTLREAINAANGNADANTITFDATVFAARQTLATQTEFPELTSDISISGPTAPGAGVTISQVNAGTGALFVSGGTVNLTNLTFTSPNSYGVQNSGGDGNLTVRGCTFAGNFIGLTFNSGTTTVSNCTFSGNTQYGIKATTNCSIDSSTLSGNKTGLYVDYLTATVSNTIIAGNTTNVETDRSYGTVNDAGHNILTGTAADAGLGALADNGGPTQTFALQTGSPAIDAGNSALTTDQRGRVRPFDFPNVANAAGGNGSDIGAFEAEILAPFAGDVSGATVTGKPIGIVLSSDTPGATFEITGGPANGIAVITANDDGLTRLFYRSNSGFSGTDTVQFVAINSSGARSQPATATITVTFNAVPIADDVSGTVPAGGLFSATLTGRDPDDNDAPPVRYGLVTLPAHGTASIAKGSDGVSRLYYRSDNGYVGTDTFQFRAIDKQGAYSDPATATINVTSNSAPTTQDVSGTVQSDKILGLKLTGSDPDGSIAAYKITRQPLHGRAALSRGSDGVFVLFYRSDASYVGDDSIGFVAIGSKGARSAVANAAITVTAPPQSDAAGTSGGHS